MTPDLTYGTSGVFFRFFIRASGDAPGHLDTRRALRYLQTLEWAPLWPRWLCLRSLHGCVFDHVVQASLFRATNVEEGSYQTASVPSCIVGSAFSRPSTAYWRSRSCWKFRVQQPIPKKIVYLVVVGWWERLTSHLVSYYSWDVGGCFTEDLGAAHLYILAHLITMYGISYFRMNMKWTKNFQ